MVTPGAASFRALLPARRPRPNRRRLLALVAVLSVVAPAALGVTAVATATPAAAASSGQWDPRIEPIAKKVAQLRKLDFEHPVPVTFLSGKAFDKKVTVDADKLSKKAKAGYAKSTGRLAALGLVPHDTDLVKSENSLHSSSVLAFYTPEKKRIFVRGTKVDTPQAKVTVAHELTHALQDQHFDLTKLEKDAAKTKSSDALRSLVEGDAVRVQKLYLKTLSDADQQAYDAANNSDVQQAQDQSDAADVPESLQVLLEAPYAFGDSMLQVVLADGHEAELDKQFEHPPTNDLAYLLPTTLVDRSRFQKVTAPTVHGKGEKREGTPDTFGAFALYLVLSQQLPVDQALSIADGWGGDAMVDYRKDGQQCVRAAFVGRTTADTQAITDGLQTWVAAQPAGSATVAPKRGTAVLSSCDVATPRAAALHGANEALTLAANRDGLLGVIMEQGVARGVALCTADGVVRDAAFQPLLEQAATDPTAEPDPQTLATLRARVTVIARDCATKGTSGSPA